MPPLRAAGHRRAAARADVPRAVRAPARQARAAASRRRSPSGSLAYAWPGNIRELRNCIERAVALARFEEVIVEDLPAQVRDYRATHVLVAANDPSELVPLGRGRAALRRARHGGGGRQQAAGRARARARPRDALPKARTLVTAKGDDTANGASGARGKRLTTAVRRSSRSNGLSKRTAMRLLGPFSGRVVAEGRHQDDGGVPVRLAEHLEDLEARADGHANVGDDEVDGIARRSRPSCGRRCPRGVCRRRPARPRRSRRRGGYRRRRGASRRRPPRPGCERDGVHEGTHGVHRPCPRAGVAPPDSPGPVCARSVAFCDMAHRATVGPGSAPHCPRRPPPPTLALGLLRHGHGDCDHELDIVCSTHVRARSFDRASDPRRRMRVHQAARGQRPVDAGGRGDAAARACAFARRADARHDRHLAGHPDRLRHPGGRRVLRVRLRDHRVDRHQAARRRGAMLQHRTARRSAHAA